MIEEMLPEGNKGKAKLDFLYEMLILGHSALEAAWPVIEKVVALIVKFMNDNEKFQTTKQI